MSTVCRASCNMHLAPDRQGLGIRGGELIPGELVWSTRLLYLGVYKRACHAIVVSLTSNLRIKGREVLAHCIFFQGEQDLLSLPSGPFLVPTMGFRLPSTHLQQFSVTIKSSTKILFSRLRDFSGAKILKFSGS